MKSPGVAILAPSFGPAVVTAFGTDVPILALALSVLALLLSRWIAPPPLRALTKPQEVALTALLLIFLFMAVTGHMPLIGTGKPLTVGMAVVWGAGLGFSGLLIVEIVGERVRDMIRTMLGGKP